MENKFEIDGYAFVKDGVYFGAYGKVLDVNENKVKVDLEGFSKEWIFKNHLHSITEQDYNQIRDIETGLGDLSREETSILQAIMESIFGKGNFNFYFYNPDIDDYISEEHKRYSETVSKMSEIESYIPVSEQRSFREPKFDFNFFRKRWKKTKKEFFAYLYELREQIEILLEHEEYNFCRKYFGNYAYYMKTLDKEDKEEYNAYCTRKNDWMIYREWTQDELDGVKQGG